ncbi:MAG: endospore germination permease [Bacillaceae bacterium]|nr:endospore germination permease [Bacillaceae bacterium]
MQLRRRTSLFFLFMTLPIVGHVIILSILWDIAGRDAWISVFLATPFGLLAAYLTWKLINLQQDCPLPELSRYLWGPILGQIFNSIWFFYFFVMAMITVISLFDMFHSGFYPETPMWFLGFTLIVLVIYSLMKGIKVIAWVAGLLTLIIMISGHSITVLLSPQREWRHLLPILENGWYPPMMGAILLIAVWSEFLALTVLSFRKSHSRSLLYLLLIGAFANTIMMLSVAAGTVAVFGFEHVDNMLYPVLSSVRMVTLGFIDRFDVYGLSLMLFGCFVRTALFLYAAIETLPKRLVQNYRNWVTLGAGIVLFITSLFSYTNKLEYEKWIRYYVLTAGMWSLPLLYFIRGWFVNRKKKSAPSSGA